MESDEVASVRVRRTGESDIRTRNIMIEDLNVLRSRRNFKKIGHGSRVWHGRMSILDAVWTRQIHVA